EKPGDESPPLHLSSPESQNPEAAIAGRELEGALSEALRALPERERAAFAMCRFEGMPYKDIAEALGASEPAVKSLTHRATVAVAKRLEPLTSGAGAGAATRKASE